MNDIDQIFMENGGIFCVPYTEFLAKHKRIRAYIFDWDGVFNDGTKDQEGSSSFSEVDAMGTNLMRFSHYLRKGELPVVAILSGEHNVRSFQLGEREHFHSLYYKVKNKHQALDHLLSKFALNEDEVAFVYDDVLDLGIAERCGLRIMVNRKGNPLFRSYVVRNNLADYLTAQSGGQYAVRESCELLMGASENADTTMQLRSQFAQEYASYLEKRDRIQSTRFTIVDGIIHKVG